MAKAIHQLMKPVPRLFFLLLLCSCGLPEQKGGIVYEQGNVKLQVAVAYNLAEYSEYPPILSTARTSMLFSDSPKIIAAHLDTVFEDSIKSRVVSAYTKLPQKSLSITIFSLLTNDLQKTIDLQSDTTISFGTSYYGAFTKGDTRDLLNLSSTDSDTIFIAHKISGCFADEKEKLVLVKSGRNYKITGRKNNNSLGHLKASIPASLFTSNFHYFISGSSNLANTCFSTASSRTYIRKGNIIYTLPVIYHCNGDDRKEMYNVFKKSIGIVL